MNTAQDHIYGWANAWATVKVHVHGVVIRDVGVDGAGNWSTYIGRQDPNRRIEAQQYRLRKTLVWLDRNKCCRKVCRSKIPSFSTKKTLG